MESNVIFDFTGGNENQIKNEVCSLLKLYKKPHFPILLSKNINKKYIYINYCGVKLTDTNIPPNWKEQLKKIVKTLYENKVYNNDMWKNNFLIKEDTIYLIDFGWAKSFPYHPFINITTEDTFYDNFLDILDNVYQRVIEERLLFQNEITKNQ